jgi:hypothetical protein
MSVMASRPCRPGTDLKQLWQFLLPGTSLPACGVPEESDEAAKDEPETDADRKLVRKRNPAD